MAQVLQKMSTLWESGVDVQTLHFFILDLGTYSSEPLSIILLKTVYIPVSFQIESKIVKHIKHSIQSSSI